MLIVRSARSAKCLWDSSERVETTQDVMSRSQDLTTVRTEASLADEGLKRGVVLAEFNALWAEVKTYDHRGRTSSPALIQC
jgi:hypothetical protein